VAKDEGIWMRRRSLRQAMLAPFIALLIVIPLLLFGLFMFERSIFKAADREHAQAVAGHAADMTAFAYEEVAREYALLVPLAVSSHRELTRSLPESIDSVDIEALVSEIRSELPEGFVCEVAAITPEYVIHATSYEPEIGLDLGQFADAVAGFKEAWTSAVPVVAFPVVDSVGTHVRLFSLQPAPSRQYFTQLSLCSADADRIFASLRERLAATVALREADVYLYSLGEETKVAQVFDFRTTSVRRSDSSRALNAVRSLATTKDRSLDFPSRVSRSGLEFYQQVDLNPDLVGGLPFGAVVRIETGPGPYQDALGAHTGVITMTILVILVALLLAALALRRTFQEPIRALATHLASGTPIPDHCTAHSTVELATIARTFNDHLARIEQGEGELRSLYEQTEQRVRDRTSDLRATNAQLTESERELKALSERLLSVQEDQMRRISLELHDEFGQTLVGMRFMLQSLANKLPADHASVCMEIVIGCQEALDRALSEVRHLIEILRPAILDAAGLGGAIEWLGRQYGDAVEVRVSVSQIPDSLEERVRLAAFRIAQEAVCNAVKHADARAIELTLVYEKGNGLVLTIADDGRGFVLADDTSRLGESPRFGLDSMRERALLTSGTLQLESSPSRGTTVRAVWLHPLAVTESK
jgi:signal transduction histidine kinase